MRLRVEHTAARLFWRDERSYPCAEPSEPVAAKNLAHLAHPMNEDRGRALGVVLKYVRAPRHAPIN